MRDLVMPVLLCIAAWAAPSSWLPRLPQALEDLDGAQVGIGGAQASSDRGGHRRAPPTAGSVTSQYLPDTVGFGRFEHKSGCSRSSLVVSFPLSLRLESHAKIEGHNPQQSYPPVGLSSKILGWAVSCLTWETFT
ncbi:uncharacterized protein [Lolium perenne]|uniref:uncharacterized protein isoform X2 n=1 Tax=Lolium perenne TaxID=4522 RepID=UPI0021F51C72|nr:uncharacterized protein LOC127296001 [Lolium perenne]